jgi:hypothetical protein
MIYEHKPEKDTPENIREDLRAYGGESPDGKAVWRLVLAENCKFHCFGARNHIERGKVRAMGDNSRPTDIQPNRIEVGEHWIPRYKHRGWILERWFPASVWGTKEKWDGEKASDGRTKLLAAFPSRGDYMMMAGPWATIQQAGDLYAAIRCYNIQQRRNPVNWPNHLHAMTVFEEQERQAAADAYADELAAQHRLGMGSILQSVSSSAQRFRNIVSKHTASGVNLGASEQWGS